MFLTIFFLFFTVPKPNIKFDFFGDQAAAMAIYAARRRRMQAAGIKYIYRMMERTEDGTFVEANLKTALKVKSSSEKDKYKEYMSEDSSNDSDEGSDEEREEKKVKNEPEKKRRIYYCMDERLFSEYITFTTKVCVSLFSLPLFFHRVTFVFIYYRLSALKNPVRVKRSFSCNGIQRDCK